MARHSRGFIAPCAAFAPVVAQQLRAKRREVVQIVSHIYIFFVYAIQEAVRLSESEIARRGVPPSNQLLDGVQLSD